MDFEQLIEWLSTLLKFLGVFGVVVEITPTKISPLKWIGNRLFSSQNESIKELQKQLSDVKTELYTDKVERIRSELLEFSNSCMNHRQHTEKEFENIFDKEQKYNKLCEEFNIENGYTEDNMKFVHEIYRTCKRDGRFLEFMKGE